MVLRKGRRGEEKKGEEWRGDERKRVQKLIVIVWFHLKFERKRITYFLFGQIYPLSLMLILLIN